MTVRDIQAAVAARYGTTVAELTGPARDEWLVAARAVAYRLCRAGQQGVRSVEREIAKNFNRDQTTIRVGLRRPLRWDDQAIHDELFASLFGPPMFRSRRGASFQRAAAA